MHSYLNGFVLGCDSAAAESGNCDTSQHPPMFVAATTIWVVCREVNQHSATQNGVL
jgi:hypothetical protein